MWSPVNGQGAPQEPVRGSLGADIQGPTNGALTSQNPDTLAPPTTDHGVVYVLSYLGPLPWLTLAHV